MALKANEKMLLRANLFYFKMKEYNGTAFLSKKLKRIYSFGELLTGRAVSNSINTSGDSHFRI